MIGNSRGQGSFSPATGEKDGPDDACINFICRDVRGLRGRFPACIARAKWGGNRSARVGSWGICGNVFDGLGNTNPGAIDPGIPGFVGPLGNGISSSPNVVNPAFVGWANVITSYLPAPGVDPGWNDPTMALGPVTGDNFDVVSLGDLNSQQIAAYASPGQITLSFNRGIRNSAGPDFAVFENAFGTANSVFADLAYVEVSSDGSHFARFPSTSLTPSAVGPYGSIDPTNVHNLAGKHVNAYGNSWGTPFDLATWRAIRWCSRGRSTCNGIHYVRLIDIPGDGSSHDSAGRSIYDAWPTYGSGGFDLEAIGVTTLGYPAMPNLDGVVDAADLTILRPSQSPRAALPKAISTRTGSSMSAIS